MEQVALNFDAAKEKRHGAMRAATTRADRQVDGWSDIAYARLLCFARTHQWFISEDLSDETLATAAFPQPDDLRAWGSVYTRAIREGVIAQDGAGRSRRRASICPRYRSMIFVGDAA